MLTASSRKIWWTFLIALLATDVFAAIWLQAAGFGDDNIRTTLRYSGQLVFVIYLVVIVTRPLQQLLQKPWTTKLLKNRRLIGVAFAGVMTAHLVLIVLRYSITPGLSLPPLQNLVTGAGAFALIYAMFITSFNGPARAITPKAWKILHRIGLIWIGYVFAFPSSLDALSDPNYLKVAVPVLIAILIRFVAWRRSNQQGS